MLPEVCVLHRLPSCKCLCCWQSVGFCPVVALELFAAAHCKKHPRTPDQPAHLCTLVWLSGLHLFTRAVKGP